MECLKCGIETNNLSNLCDNCKKTVADRVICKRCNMEASSASAFCSNCGNGLHKTKINSRHLKINKTFTFNIASVLISVLFLILSFLPIMYMNFKDIAEMPIKDKVTVNNVNIISSFFLSLSDYDMEDFTDDMQEALKENLSNSTLQALGAGNKLTKDQQEEVNDFLKSINFFNALAIDEVYEHMPNLYFNMTIYMILAFAMILVPLAALSTSIIGLLNNKILKFNKIVFIFYLIICIAFLSFTGLTTSFSGIAAGLLWYLIFSFVGIAGIFLFQFSESKVFNKKIFLKNLVSTALVLLLIITINGGTTKFEYKNDVQNLSYKITVNERYITYNSVTGALLNPDFEFENMDSIVSAYNAIAENNTYTKKQKSKMFNLIGFAQSMLNSDMEENSNFVLTIAAFLPLIHFLAVCLLLTLLYSYLLAFIKNTNAYKFQKTMQYSLVAIGVVLIAIMVIIMARFNESTNFLFKGKDYSLKILFPILPIVTVIFAAILATFRAFFIAPIYLLQGNETQSGIAQISSQANESANKDLPLTTNQNQSAIKKLF